MRTIKRAWNCSARCWKCTYAYMKEAIKWFCIRHETVSNLHKGMCKTECEFLELMLATCKANALHSIRATAMQQLLAKWFKWQCGNAWLHWAQLSWKSFCKPAIEYAFTHSKKQQQNRQKQNAMHFIRRRRNVCHANAEWCSIMSICYKLQGGCFFLQLFHFPFSIFFLA